MMTLWGSSLPFLEKDSNAVTDPSRHPIEYPVLATNAQSVAPTS
jgi:hypothetical protein